jgi:hypothetical protein
MVTTPLWLVAAVIDAVIRKFADNAVTTVVPVTIPECDPTYPVVSTPPESPN